MAEMNDLSLFAKWPVEITITTYPSIQAFIDLLTFIINTQVIHYAEPSIEALMKQASGSGQNVNHKIPRK